ncbi:hypothetical protein GALMADRAFT_217009 [Galerina marginata CBS 339.88]|uniref:RNI-like protein n=1 Tax=Galerina marginata (strain CBS 339.88) TaxID=685588 RepID=A0A067SFE1_GALM3|nr:hypothetical protein GALMADRAFT_217009 [Galerina marginata CBS 339.88]
MNFETPNSPSDDWQEMQPPVLDAAPASGLAFVNLGVNSPEDTDAPLGSGDAHKPLDEVDTDRTITQADLIQDLTITAPAEEPVVLDSFVPLLQKLDSTVFLDDVTNEYDLVGDINDSEWKSLQAYANRVVELSVSDSPGQSPKVANPAFFRLGQYQGRTPLFPSLSRLQITNTTSSSLFYLDMLFSPSLTTLTINSICSPQAVAFFLKRVAAEASLSTLILDSVNLPSVVANALSHCLHLEVLELKKLKEIVPFSLKAMAHLPHLKILKFDATDVTFLQTKAEFDDSGPKFQSLEELRFVGSGTILPSIVGDLASAANLQHMHIELTKYTMIATRRIGVNVRKAVARRVEYSPVGDLLAGISRQLPLRSLVVIFNNNEIGYDNLPGSTISCLSSLRNLEQLEISGVGISDLDRALAGTNELWPKIQTLRLPLSSNSSNNARTGVYGLSLSTLRHLARSCLHLTSIQSFIILPSDHSSLTGFDDKPISHPLKSLSVGCFPEAQWRHDSENMDKVYHTASCLYAIFPNLDTIQTHEQYASEFWTEVHKLVKIYQKIRALDRLRYGSTWQDGHGPDDN